MKLAIESLASGKVKITLNFEGKEYSETWEKYKFGYRVIDKPIVVQMECDDVYREENNIEDLLDFIDIGNFIRISEQERAW